MNNDTDYTNDIIPAGEMPAKLAAAKAQGAWQPVSYEDIFTPEGDALRRDYKTICDKWMAFNGYGNDTHDGYEYAICRLPAGEGGGDEQTV
jgi:hypothetical protein